MKTIWKVELKIDRIQEFKLPKESKILSAQVIDNTGCLWVEFDKKNTENSESLKILTIPTGSEFSESADLLEP